MNCTGLASSSASAFAITLHGKLPRFARFVSEMDGKSLMSIKVSTTPCSVPLSPSYSLACGTMALPFITSALWQVAFSPIDTSAIRLNM